MDVYQPTIINKVATLDISIQDRHGKSGTFEYYHLLTELRGVRTDKWKLIPGKLYRRKAKEFCYLSGELVCTESVWRMLQPHVERDVQALEVDCGDQIVYILNVLYRDDLIDVPTSSVVTRESFFAGDLSNPQFIEEKIKDVMLFRTRATRIRIFCTENFKILCDFFGLKEIEFGPVESAMAGMMRIAGFVKPPTAQ